MSENHQGVTEEKHGSCLDHRSFNFFLRRKATLLTKAQRLMKAVNVYLESKKIVVMMKKLRVSTEELKFLGALTNTARFKSDEH